MKSISLQVNTLKYDCDGYIMLPEILQQFHNGLLCLYQINIVEFLPSKTSRMYSNNSGVFTFNISYSLASTIC